jgi:hypothetical protein
MPERVQADPQHRDVEAEVAQRSGQPPAWALGERRPLGVVYAGGDRGDPAWPAGPGAEYPR